MRTRHWMLLLLIVLIALPIAAGPAGAKMPPGSFISRPVTDGRDLAELVRHDSVVAERFSKHFGMDVFELCQYFQEYLEVDTLTQSRKYRLYFVGRDGRVIIHEKYLQAGDRVLVDPIGRPVVLMSCGNPFTKRLPVIVAKVLPQKPTPLLLPPPPAPVPPPPEQVVVMVKQPEPVEVMVLVEPPVEFVSGSITSWILPTLVAGGAVAFSGSDDQPIPEPASMLVLGIGAAGLLFRARRKRRQ